MGLSLTVTLGDVIQIAAMLVAVAVAYSRLSERIAVLETKMDAMWDRRDKVRA